MARSAKGSGGDPATASGERDLGVLLRHEREAPDRPLLEALLAARCWSTPESRAAAAGLLERHAPWGTDLGPGEAFLVGAPSPHQAALFLDWLQGSKDRTLEAIGRPRRMSGPAVGDAVARAGRRMRAVLEHAPPPWPWLVAELRRRLGSVTTEDVLGGSLERLGATRGSLPASLAAWLAGPYAPVRGRPGWLATDPASLLSRSARAIRADGGVRRLADVADELADFDLAADMLVAWLQAFGAVVVHDLVVAIDGPLVNAVERVLDAHGAARTVAQIADDLAAGGRTVADEASLAAAVRGRRFRMTEDGAVGLAAWGDTQPKRPAKSKTQRPRAGPPGSAAGARPADHARPDPRKPGGSLRQVAGARSRRPATATAGHGARQVGPLGRPSHPPREPVWFSVPVDEDVLRGEEAAVPVELVERLGLAAQGRRTFSGRWGPVTLAYEGAQPTRGSLRAVARAVGARPGDTLLLDFSPAGDVAVQLRGTSHPDPELPAGVATMVDADVDVVPLAQEAGEGIVRDRPDRPAALDGGQVQTLFPDMASKGAR